MKKTTLPLTLAALLTVSIASRAQEPTPSVEAEFVASDVFRSGSLVARMWKELHFDGQYLGTESADAGITAISWEFRWKALSISPGFGVGFGGGVDTAPMVTLRWKLETRRWLSQGYGAQSLHRQIPEGETGNAIYASVLDKQPHQRPAGSDGDRRVVGTHQVSGGERVEGRSARRSTAGAWG
jgi:hypothetical protein